MPAALSRLSPRLRHDRGDERANDNYHSCAQPCRLDFRRNNDICDSCAKYLGISGALPMKFLGREKELQRLEELKGQSGARLAVITGRRRIGKSRLVQEFARQFARFLEFSGLPPEPGLGPVEQRAEFTRQLSDQCALPRFASDDW